MSLGDLNVAEPVNLNGPYPAIVYGMGVGDFYLVQVSVPSGQTISARAFSNSGSASPDAIASIVIGGKVGILTPAAGPALPGGGLDVVVAKVNASYSGQSLVTVRIQVLVGGVIRRVDVPFSFQVH